MQKVFPGTISLLAVFLGLPACGDAGTDARASMQAAPSPAPAHDTTCAEDAYLEGSLVGAIDALIRWTPGDLACAGGPRPDDEGIRLSFARPGDDGTGLTVIIALPALERQATGQDLLANVTIILEGEGRFFSTRNRETCWAAVSGNEHTGGERYSVEGEIYCIGPLAEVHGDASVTIDGLSFRGSVDWGSG